MKKIFSIIIMFSIIVFFMSSCYYDNFEEMNPKDTVGAITCDTAGILTFVKQIEPVTKKYCSISGCHSGNSPSAGLSLVTYSEVKNSSISGKFLSSIVWDGTVSQMPKGSINKLSDCDIAKVKKWIVTNYVEQ